MKFWQTKVRTYNDSYSRWHVRVWKLCGMTVWRKRLNDNLPY